MSEKPGAWSSRESAEEWRRTSAARNASLVTVTERMLLAADVRAGRRVLVLGAGTGDDAAVVADRVGPTGRVLATDISPAMVEVCAATMKELGLSQVESRPMDAAANDVAPGSFDAVFSRNGLMFTPRLDLALAGARRALVAGGRFAMCSWASPERNPFHGVALEVARQFGMPPGPPPEILLAYSLSDADALAAKLVAAGFSDVHVERVPAPRPFPSLQAAVGYLQHSPATALFAHLPEERRRQAWAAVEHAFARFTTADGWAADGESLVASGRA